MARLRRPLKRRAGGALVSRGCGMCRAVAFIAPGVALAATAVCLSQAATCPIQTPGVNNVPCTAIIVAPRAAALNGARNVYSIINYGPYTSPQVRSVGFVQFNAFLGGTAGVGVYP